MRLLPFTTALFAAVSFTISFVHAAPRNKCFMRGFTIAYDIEIEWDERIPTKMRSLKLVYALTSAVSRDPIRNQDVPIAVATVRLPEGGLEVEDYLKSRIQKMEADAREVAKFSSEFDKFFKSKDATSYAATLGIASPLEVINPPPEYPNLKVEIKKMRTHYDFVTTPTNVSKMTTYPFASMYNELNSNDFDDVIIACMQHQQAERLKEKVYPVCKLEDTPISRGPAATIGDLSNIAVQLMQAFTK